MTPSSEEQLLAAGTLGIWQPFWCYCSITCQGAQDWDAWSLWQAKEKDSPLRTELTGGSSFNLFGSSYL